MARWHFMQPDGEAVLSLKSRAGLDELCARVLANRGVRPEEAEGFLSPTLAAVKPPDEEPWRVAARRIARAVKDGERIGIFGDYDTDGITSASVLYLALGHYTSNVIVGLPTRQTGYGLLEPYVRDMFAEGVDLLVTCDCGISNWREVEVARELGMDVIVTDHHLPPEKTPEAAVAVLDPKLWDADDPLAGVGVAWKLAWAVARELGDADARRRLGRLLDFVAVGTVVDIAPLRGDNRALALAGLRYLNKTLGARVARPGLAALVQVAGVRGELDEGDLGWKLGPRINSIGRIKNPRPALDLMLTDDRRLAFRIASELNQLNGDRQRRTQAAVARALEEVNPEQDFKVVVTEEVGGLAGLIAGRVASAAGRPTAILTRRADGSYGGSARAGETDVDLYGALHEAREFLDQWGGHRKAAGLSVRPGLLDPFVERVNREVRRQVEADPEVLEPPIEVDAEVRLEDLRNGFLDWHERLAPFGSGNHKPVFAASGLRVLSAREIWPGMHLLTLEGGTKAKLPCDPQVLPEGPFDAVFTAGRSRYSGEAEVEIADWRG
ncbi:Single-stranded DNA-specific exonuclease [Rubrobacter radiotolerans]|uniref:Single-stranded-DNA-specific exonuclease RecJ n=1 Tax=Rubrobacter radiotolerans TaxID=42256 RepID=A0A023X194_RUBRA|nr:DHH family phosphoesterase [Rubrobacter radiotolerans]AHY46063.1 Single-stranded DNA-specific exonuclease [Rubrobacter radiotolerans]MDX5893473.1 DHH family phosphoesterase [Rubrobacter radiotolerans]SMC03797.1 exonuclease RecJ [Rubrobacter radiotolerans DSM 5868]